MTMRPSSSEKDPQQALNLSWEKRYREGRTGWDRGQPSPALALWRDRGLLQGGRILVPGCGRGHELVELAALGLQVTAIDLAPSALQAARAALVGRGLAAELIAADVLDWQPAEPFDLVYEQTCLCALHPDRWPRYAAQLYGWLKPGGWLLAAFMQTGRTGGPPFDSPPQTMRVLFSPPAWQWPAELIRIEHPSGLHELCGALQRN